MTLASIIYDVQKGSDLARQLLVGNMKGQMISLCGRYMKDPRDAEERVADGFRRCFRAITNFTYESDNQFFSWLKKIMINECLKKLKNNQSFMMVPETERDDEGLEPEVFTKMSAEDILQLIGQLPTGYRAVFNMHALDGMDHKEIAAVLGISESASRSQLARSKTFLQKKLIENGIKYVNTRSVE